MKKKLLTTAMAATMVVGGVMSASAETITGAWWTAWTESYEVKDKVEFDIEVKGGKENWNGVAAIFTNVKTAGEKAPAEEAEGYKEYAVVRADSWGWGGGDNKSLDGNAIEYTNDIKDANGDGDIWDDFRAVMADAHIDATISKTATGIKLEYAVEGANGVSFNYTATTDVDTSAGLYVFFGCDSAEVTVTKVPSPTTDKPEVDGDVNDSVNTSVTTGGVIDCEGLKDGQTLEMKDVEETSAVYKKVAELLSKVEAFAKSKFVVKELDVMADGKVVKVEEGKYEVTLALDEKLKDAKSVIVYRLEGENLVFIDHVDVEGKAFTFTTDHFSTYVFVGSDKTVKDTPAGSIPTEIKSETTTEEPTTEETTTVAKDEVIDGKEPTADSATAVPVVVAVVAAGAALAVAATKKKEA